MEEMPEATDLETAVRAAIKVEWAEFHWWRFLSRWVLLTTHESWRV